MSTIGSSHFSQMGDTLRPVADSLPLSEHFLSQLGMEVSNLGRDVNAAAAAMPAMMQSILGSFVGAGANAPANPGAAGQAKQTLVKLAFVSVLQEAMDKASKSQHFNVETAINDMWIHLDSVRQMAKATSPADSDAASLRLQHSLQKRSQLFSLINEALKTQNDMNMAVIRNLH